MNISITDRWKQRQYLWLLNGLLHNGDVQGEEHPSDEPGLRASELLHQGVHLLTHLLTMLLLEKGEVKQ